MWQIVFVNNFLKFGNRAIGVAGRKEDFQRASDNLLLCGISNGIFPQKRAISLSDLNFLTLFFKVFEHFNNYHNFL